MTATHKPDGHPMYENILELLFDGKTQGDAPCFIEPRGNMVRKFTRTEIAENVSIFARGMAFTEFRRGKRIAIVAKTSFHSLVASLGNLLNGCINVMIPVDATAEEQRQALSSSRAEALIIEDFETARTVMSQVQYLPQLRQIIVLNKTKFEKQPEILTYVLDDLMTRGEAKADNAADQLKQIEKDDEAYIFFVRDEFNHLKPISMSHHEIMGHLYEMLGAFHSVSPFNRETVRTLSVVPFHRPFSHIAGFFLPLLSHYSFMAVDKEESWKSGNLPIRPQLLIAESQFLENLYTAVKESIQQAGGIYQYIWSQTESWISRNRENEEWTPGLFSGIKRLLFQPVLRHKLAEQLGGDIALAVSIDKEMSEESSGFYAAIHLPILFNRVKPQELFARHTTEKQAA